MPYGARILIVTDRKCAPKMRMAQWDPFNLPILANVERCGSFEDIEDGPLR